MPLTEKLEIYGLSLRSLRSSQMLTKYWAGVDIFYLGFEKNGKSLIKKMSWN